MGLRDFFRQNLGVKLGALFGSPRSLDETLAEIEELLVLADVSTGLSHSVCTRVRKRLAPAAGRDEILAALQAELLAVFAALPAANAPAPGKRVSLLVGVNGSGKTTSAAKLGCYYRHQGHRPLLAAADTFRAAGSSQLSLWGERLGLPVIGGDKGADPGSVVFNSLQSFQGQDNDVLIIDTAGRVQTRDNLMRELEKLVKIIRRFYPDQPDECLLVLDATTGQNALAQAEAFSAFAGLTGIVLSKLDGSAKGGTVLTIAASLKLSVRYVGVGEGADDLLAFSPGDFVSALLRTEPA
jgi:fused signal recognition particle receptor